MKEWEYKENIEEFSESILKEKLVEDFENSEVPYKIRKVKLLERSGLPVPKRDILKIDQIDNLGRIVQERLEETPEVVIRLASIPDKLSMPVFYVGRFQEIESKTEELKSFVRKDKTIKNFIISEAIPQNEVSHTIVGRLIEGVGKHVSLAQTLELYQGSKTTGIFNKVSVSDENFIQIRRNYGEFWKIPEEFQNRRIDEGPINNILFKIKKWRENIDLIAKVLAKSRQVSRNNLSFSLEFVRRKNSSIYFVDFD